MIHRLSHNGSRVLFVLLACTLLVSLMVLGAYACGKETPAEIWYDPTSFSLYATEGGANPSETLWIRNYGGGTLDWTVSDDAAWLTLNPTSGTSTGQMDEVSLLVDITGMSAGSYSATITIEAPEATNTPQTVPVSLTIVSLTITSFSVSPSEVDPGELVTITVGVENTGATRGSRTIELWVEGTVEDSQHVTLDPGATESITFTMSREEPGTYRVAVDGFRGEFEVATPDSTSTPTPPPAVTPTPAPTPTPLPRDPRSAQDMKAYITPNDAMVEQKVEEILDAWWRWGYSDFEAIRQWVSTHITYVSDSEVHGVEDYWQLPAETLMLETGDCEDFAILLCTMYRIYGVPADQVYVAVGCSEESEDRHAYLIESYSTGEFRLLEPQEDVWMALFWGELLHQWETVYCFNDEEYVVGRPTYDFPRYHLTGYPLGYAGRVHLKKYLTAGESLDGMVIEVPPGDTSIWRDWGIRIKNPEGKVVFSEGGDSLQYSFAFTALQTGYYWIELWNSGYTKVVELQIEPSDWEFIGGEHGSREAE